MRKRSVYDRLIIGLAFTISCGIGASQSVPAQSDSAAPSLSAPGLMEALEEPEVRERLRLGGWSGLDNAIVAPRAELSPNVHQMVRGRALYMVAGADFKRENYEQAMQTYRNALEYLPGNQVIQLAIARCEMMLDDTDDALRIAQEVLAENDQQIEAWQLKAEIHGARDDNAAMIDALEHAAALQPMNVELLSDLADAYRRVLNFQKMNETYAVVASIEPRNLRALFFLSYGHEVLGETDKAVRWIDQAIEKFPKNEQLHQRKIEILMKAQQHKEVRKALLQAFAEARDGAPFAERYRRYAKQYPPAGDPTAEIKALSENYPLNAKAQRFYIEALEAKGEYQEALKLVEETLKDHPNDGELLLRLAELLVKAGRGEEALDALERAAQTPILTADQLMNLSELQARRGRTSAAIATLRNALEEHPDNAEIGIELATLLIRRDRNGEAMDVLDKTEPLLDGLATANLSDERIAGIYGRFGALQLKLGEDNKAITNLKKAINRAGDEPKHWLLLYTAQLAIDDLSAAEDTFEDFLKRGVTIEKNLSAVQQFLTLALDKGAYELSARIIDRVIVDPNAPSNYLIALFGEVVARPDAVTVMTTSGKLLEIQKAIIDAVPDAEQAYFTGLLFELRGEEDLALQAYQKQFASKERRYDTALRLIYLNGDKDRLDDARAVYNKVTEMARRDDDYMRLYDFHQQFATVLINAGLGEEARDILVVSAPDAEIRQPVRAAELYRVLGDVQAQLGDIQEAHKAYEQAIALDPKNILALNNYGYHLAERGERLDQAERLVKRALRLEPNEGFILDSLGWIYYQKREFDKAVQLLQAAVAIDASSWELHDHLAEAYKSLGRWEEAVVSWETALELAPDDEVKSEVTLRSKLQEARQRAGKGVSNQKGENQNGEE